MQPSPQTINGGTSPPASVDILGRIVYVVYFGMNHDDVIAFVWQPVKQNAEAVLGPCEGPFVASFSQGCQRAVHEGLPVPQGSNEGRRVQALSGEPRVCAHRHTQRRTHLAPRKEVGVVGRALVGTV